MRLRNAHLASSSVEYGSLLFGLGVLISAILVLASAPVWVFYLSPILAIPLAIRAYEAQTGGSGRSEVGPRRAQLFFAADRVSVGAVWIVLPLASLVVGALLSAWALTDANPFLAGGGLVILLVAAWGCWGLLRFSLDAGKLRDYKIVHDHFWMKRADTKVRRDELALAKLWILRTAAGDWVVKKPSGELVSSGHRTREQAREEALRYLEGLQREPREN